MKARVLFDLPESLPFRDWFDPETAPWEWVPRIAEALNSFSWPADGAREVERPGGGLTIEGDVYIHPSVRLPGFATIQGPAYIGAGTEIRPGAYIRGNVIVGEGCVLGNSCEFKNALLMDRVCVPHFSYVGDSILGSDSHLGAGAVLSNLRLDQRPVTVVADGERVSTGLVKLGAILGEAAEVGCNTVLQPGTILGKRALVAPGIACGGTIPANQIARMRGAVVMIPRRD